MKKQDLLKRIDADLLEKIMGFCYKRTSHSYEAQELCSDILYQLVKASKGDGEVKDFYGFLWKVAHNVYADFSERKSKVTERFYQEDPEEIFKNIAMEENDEENIDEEFEQIIKAMSFLTRAYREVMILYYLEGKSITEIASIQKTSEVAIRQRLFSARKSIRSEVGEMEDIKKPIVLDKVDFTIIGTGYPSWGDPRSVSTRQMSKHIVMACYKKPKTAKEISKELNIPMSYVEEELEILTKGENGEYGLLRNMGNDRYGVNIILLDKQGVIRAHDIYISKISEITDIIMNHVTLYQNKYLQLPYLNRNVDISLILWHHINRITMHLTNMVYDRLGNKYFANRKEVKRPFSVFGYFDIGISYGCGQDGIEASNICGYKKVELQNIYISRILPHFHCGHNIGNDPSLQLAIRSIQGIKIEELTDVEKEYAAKAMECGYIYREDDILYTKILVFEMKDKEKIYDINNKITSELEKLTDRIAKEIHELIEEIVPDYLLNEYKFFNIIAGIPIIDLVVEALIDKGYLVPPKDRVGAEGCWMCVEK